MQFHTYETHSRCGGRFESIWTELSPQLSTYNEAPTMRMILAGERPARSLSSHELHVRIDVVEEVLVSGAEIVQAGFTGRGGEKSMLGTFPLHAKRTSHSRHMRGSESRLSRPNFFCCGELTMDSRSASKMLPSLCSG